MATSASRKQEGSEVATSFLAITAPERLFRGFLHERHLAAIDGGDLFLIDVQQNHVHAAACEHDSQRQADMTAAANNDKSSRFSIGSHGPHRLTTLYVAPAAGVPPKVNTGAVDDNVV